MGRGIALVLLATLFWGTTGTSSTYAPDSADALSIGAIRAIIGAIGLLIIALFDGRNRTRPSWPWLLIFVGAIGVAGGQLSFFTAVDRAGVAASTVLTIGVAPIFTGILSALYLHQRPSRIWVVATIVAVAGSTLMVLGTADTVGGDPVGLLFAVLGGLGYAVFVTASKRMLELGLASVDVTASIFCGAALMLIPVFFLGNWHWVLEPRGAAVALYLGIATNTVPYLLFGLGLTLVPVATAATLTLMEPLTATLLGVVWLGERLTLLQWTGVAFLLVGLLLLAIPGYFRRIFIRSA